ncbi:hypothetical protein cyc_05862 [Cyclospora cayetanensis]|uniref:Uncharacterized protein n=1 Tax=Cyclospora cayetanensis TaxID=88456 RepID=A0A1D3CRV8_9EIME|nr:hypothetical protein cyc_05862 [Cyclospora cayetanensis]
MLQLLGFSSSNYLEGGARVKPMRTKDLGKAARSCLYTSVVQRPVQRKGFVAPCEGEVLWLQQQAIRVFEASAQEQGQQHPMDIQVVQQEERPQHHQEMQKLLNQMRAGVSPVSWNTKSSASSTSRSAAAMRIAAVE